MKLHIEITDEEIEQLTQRAVSDASERLNNIAYKDLVRAISREVKSAVVSKVVNNLVAKVVERVGEEELLDQVVAALVRDNGHYSLRERLWQIVTEDQSKWIEKVWRAVLNGDLKMNVKVEE